MIAVFFLLLIFICSTVSIEYL